MLAGGGALTIRGQGFPTSPHHPLAVDLGRPDLECDIAHANTTVVACTTRRTALTNDTQAVATVRLRAGEAVAGCSDDSWWLDSTSTHDEMSQPGRSSTHARYTADF